jgi:hypothetical protein
VADARGGVALDDAGRPRGFVTVDVIASALADDRAPNAAGHPAAGHPAAGHSSARAATEDGR